MRSREILSKYFDLGEVFLQKWKQKINRERRSIRVKHQNSEQNFCKFFCFWEIVFAKSYHFVKKIFRNYKKNFCKKTPPQGTKSGKSERKNIETVNSRIDGLFFVFIFVKTPPKGLKIEILRRIHATYGVSQKSLKIQLFFSFDLFFFIGYRKGAVRDPGRSPCALDLNSPEPSRHHVTLCISMNFYLLAIKPLIWSGMMFCVWLESMHPSKTKRLAGR